MVTSKLALACAVVLSLLQMAPTRLPPDEGGAKAALEKSPRHGEYVDIVVEQGKPPMKAYVVYPEVKENAPVVVVIQEIFGLSDWLKATTDALAAEGFIAIAPDLVSGPLGPGTDQLGSRDAVTQAVRKLKQPEVLAALDKTVAYGTGLPSATKRFGVVGFCWGGGIAFQYAIHNPDLSAAVAYYGTNPHDPADIEKIKAPISGHFGGDDARVTSTVAPAVEAMKKAGKAYTPHIYDGAGHGFLRQQDGRDGANLKAAQQAWPETIRFLKENLK